jgi:hypothetical protein
MITRKSSIPHSVYAGASAVERSTLGLLVILAGIPFFDHWRKSIRASSSAAVHS